jgi:hypothetical protein
MSFQDFLNERELTPEQREARRARAKARREKRRSQREEDDQDIHISDSSWLKSQWKKFNERYFDGKLKTPVLFDSTRGDHTLGTCTNDFNPSTGKVKCTMIRINRRIENYPTFRNTMVHEMVHQWVYQNLSEEDYRRANRAGQARSRRWWNALTSPFGKDGHHGVWLTKCEELMSKFPYLKLKKYGSSDETDLTDKEVQAAVKINKNCHIVQCEPGAGRRRYFYFITDDGYKSLLKDIEAGNKSGRWTEYSFDPAKMASEIKDPVSMAGNRAWTGSYLDNLKERGIVSSWDYKELGGQKSTEPRRSRRRLWW